MAKRRRRRGDRRVRARRRRGRLRLLAWVGMVLVGGAVVVGIVAANLGGSSPTVTEDDRVLGAATVPVTIIEYGDFKCPFFARFFVETEPRLRSQYIDTGLVRLVWRDFPNIDAESHLR